MKLLVTLVLSMAYLEFAWAKSEPATIQDTKLKVSTTHNTLSTTPKPDTQYQTIQQQQLQQYQQNYQQQIYQPQPQYPQHPLQAQLQRPLHAQPQQILLPAPPQLQQIQYQPQLQAQAPQQLAHLVQKAFYVPQQQNQPATMIIITQPTYSPSGVVQGGAPQQLLNYFNGNPQARYTFLHGNYQQQAVQQPVQPTPAQTIGSYPVVAVPQYQPNVVAVPVQRPLVQHVPVPTPESAHQSAPLQLAQIAQLAAQQYSRINPSPQPETAFPSQHYQPEARAQQSIQSQIGLPIRSLPPIFTGLENFTPEQQEKIKAQLSAHFGAPLQPLPAGRVAQNEAQNKAGSQYSANLKYQSLQSGLNRNEFVPGEQVKDDGSANSAEVSKSKQYA